MIFGPHCYGNNRVLSGFKGKKVYQYIFLYWISDDSIIYNGKKIAKISVNGNLLQRKVLFRQNVFEKFGDTTWTFTLSDKINNGIILCYYHNNEGQKSFAHIFVNRTLKRKIVKKIIETLTEAAEKYGMPIKEGYVFHEYIDKENYKESPPQQEEDGDEKLFETECKKLGLNTKVKRTSPYDGSINSSSKIRQKILESI